MPYSFELDDEMDVLGIYSTPSARCLSTKLTSPKGMMNYAKTNAFCITTNLAKADTPGALGIWCSERMYENSKQISIVGREQ